MSLYNLLQIFNFHILPSFLCELMIPMQFIIRLYDKVRLSMVVSHPDIGAITIFINNYIVRS